MDEKNEEWFDRYTGRTREALKYVSDVGVSNMTLATLKRVGNALIRTANKRIRELEAAGLTDSPAYRYYKTNVGNFSLAGNISSNKAKHMVSEAWHFLKANTSSVEGTRKFLNTTVNKWLGFNSTTEQREKIFDLFHRLEKIHPSYFNRESYDSTELAADIYMLSEVLQAKEWVIDEAMQVLEQEAGTSIIFDDDMDEDLVDELTMWFMRHEE